MLERGSAIRCLIAQSGSDGRRKHRAQACFLLALLDPSAPWWLLRLGVHERRRHSAFAPVCYCAVLRTLGIALSISRFLFFIPKFFILVTASPFYAARRDKNGGRNVVRLPVISCRCEGQRTVRTGVSRLSRPQGCASEAKRLPDFFSAEQRSRQSGMKA